MISSEKWNFISKEKTFSKAHLMMTLSTKRPYPLRETVARDFKIN